MWNGCSFNFICHSDDEMHKLQDILSSASVEVDHPSTSSSWSLRQATAQDEWRKARTEHLNCLLSCNFVPERTCSRCSSPAIIRCRDCMPEEWLCMVCDKHTHKNLALHNRDSCIDGIYRPIKPTLCCVQQEGRYKLVNQGDDKVLSPFYP